MDRVVYGPEIIIPSPLASPANSGSMAANITSQPVIVQYLYAMCVTLSWSGTSPVGTIAVQGSNDFSLSAAGTVQNAGTWTNLTLNYGGSAVTTIPISGNTGQGLIDIIATGVYAIRVVYTASSGSGSITAILNAKDS